MKRHITAVILVILIFVSNLLFPQVLRNEKNSTNFLPLAVGNKWQYFESIRSSYDYAVSNFYSIKTVKITDSHVFNNKTYYKFEGEWVRYDADSLVAYYYNSATKGEGVFVDFRAVAGHSYVNYIGTVSAIRRGFLILGVSGTGVGFKYFNYSLDTPTWSYYYYLNSLGLVQFEEEVNSVMAYYGYTKRVLSGFLSADENIAHTNIDPAAPTILVKDITIDSLNNLNLLTTVNHKYSRVSNRPPQVPFGDTGCSFVDSVCFEYIYTNGNDTIMSNKIQMNSVSEINYTIALKLNENLILNNYKFYYKITARDIALLPHTTHFPSAGYQHLEITTNKYLNFYPLKKGNRWVYNIEEVDNVGNVIGYVGRNYVTVENDTILSNGTKYTKVLHNDYVRYERLDTLKGAVIEAVIDNGVVVESIKYMLSGTTNKNYFVFQNGNPDSVKCYAPYCSTILNTPNILTKKFKSIFNLFRGYKLGYNIGLTEEIYNNSLLTGLAYSLVAAKINNKVYGDTSLVGGIEEISCGINPNGFSLLQNYPNPFNPSTTISYYLPEASYVKVKIFDIIGREIAVLFEGDKPAGKYMVNFNSSKSGISLSSGVYLYCMEAVSVFGKSFKETKKMLYLK